MARALAGETGSSGTRLDWADCFFGVEVALMGLGRDGVLVRLDFGDELLAEAS